MLTELGGGIQLDLGLCDREVGHVLGDLSQGPSLGAAALEHQFVQLIFVAVTNCGDHLLTVAATAKLLDLRDAVAQAELIERQAADLF